MKYCGRYNVTRRLARRNNAFICPSYKISPHLANAFLTRLQISPRLNLFQQRACRLIQIKYKYSRYGCRICAVRTNIARICDRAKVITVNVRGWIPMRPGEDIPRPIEIRSAPRMQSAKMKSYKNVITVMNCQRQLAFSNVRRKCSPVRRSARAPRAVRTYSIFYSEMWDESHRGRTWEHVQSRTGQYILKRKPPKLPIEVTSSKNSFIAIGYIRLAIESCHSINIAISRIPVASPRVIKRHNLYLLIHAR